METLTRLLVASGFELRMRLAEPDTHDASRLASEKLIDPCEVAEAAPLNVESTKSISGLTTDDEHIRSDTAQDKQCCLGIKEQGHSHPVKQ